jgi:hypothetical protein
MPGIHGGYPQGGGIVAFTDSECRPEGFSEVTDADRVAYLYGVLGWVATQTWGGDFAEFCTGLDVCIWRGRKAEGK